VLCTGQKAPERGTVRTCVPIVNKASTAAYVGAQWEICPGPPENPPTLAPAPANPFKPAASAELFCMCASVLTIL